MPVNFPSFYRRPTRLALVLLLSSGIVAGSGCGSLSSFSRKERIKEQIDNDPRYSIDKLQGPTERRLSAANWERKKSELLREGDEATTKALTDFDAAQANFDKGNYAEAEKAFRAIVKQRRDLHENFFAKVRRAWGVRENKADDIYATYGDAIEEDAIYMLAESQYAQRKYPDAEKNYQELLVKYPSTRYLDPVTRQLFRIARYWLDFPEEPGKTGDSEVQVASMESQELGKVEEPTKQPSATTRVPVLPNLNDDTRPLFDTYGRGKQALRSIWLHDATGPLADDALMLAANHALRTEDYVEAARLYALLREQYPDSQHLKDAYLLGSHVSLATYMGPAYDGKSLETSRELKQDMLVLFPDLKPEQKKQLQEEVDRLQEAEVARLWDLVEFYRVKRMNASVKLHCYLIINRHPDSKYAEKAREELVAVEERERAWAESPFNFNKSKQPIPVAEAPQQKVPGRVTLPNESSQLPSVQLPKVEPEVPDQQKPSIWQRMNPLRKADQPPQLKRIEEQPKIPEFNDAEPKSTDPPLRASFEK